ncbi:MAG: DUF5685 family protein [Clostridia bacterium]|nr:DUF5685 family protein [Clostridia bacterium]
MFGYVRTNIPNLYVKDVVLYKSMYCGLCKSMGKTCGNLSRFTLNYDLTFLSIFCHNVLGKDVKIKKQRCIIHWFVRRPVVEQDEITNKIAALNIILAYYKLSDDVIDEGKGKIKRKIFNKAYKRARRKEPRLDAIVKGNYKALREYEKTGGDSVDMSADPFGKMLQSCAGELLGEKATEQVKRLFYNIGKWIYLIDAVDDFDKDKRKNTFNVFVNLYGDVKDKKMLIKEKSFELQSFFGQILSDINTLSNEINYNFNSDLIKNILCDGLWLQTKNILENKKCANSMKY